MNETFPAILAEAEKCGAMVFFEDESCIMLNATNGRTWSKRGETPVIYSSGQRRKVTMIGAISTKGKLYFETIKNGGINTDIYFNFLVKLKKTMRKKIFVIHDGLPSHKSKKLKELLNSSTGIKCFQLPGYSPELNPIEMLWGNTKCNLQKYIYKNVDDLDFKTKSELDSMKYNQRLLVSYYKHCYA